MSAEESTVLKILSKALRDVSCDWGKADMDGRFAVSKVSSSIESSSPSEFSSYSAALAFAEARRAAMGLTVFLTESSSISSSSIRSSSPSEIASSRISLSPETMLRPCFAALASSRFLAIPSSLIRFFSSISLRIRSL